MSTKKSKLISIILIMAMCFTAFGSMPMTASAVGGYTVDSPADLNNMPVGGTVTIIFEDEINQQGSTTFTGNQTSLTPQWTDDYTVVLDYSGLSLNNNSPLEIDFSVMNVDGDKVNGTITGKTEKETVPPTIVSTSINDGDIDIPIAGDITIIFSEWMDPACGEVYLNDEKINGGSWDQDGMVFTIPYTGLSFSASCKLSIKEFADRSENKITETEISFTTEDDKVPPVAEPTPADQALNVPVTGDIVIVFDEEMDITKGEVTLDGAPLAGGYWNGDGDVYTVPYSGLSYDTTYSYELKDFCDKSSNLMALNPLTINFTTDIKRPECTTAPADGEENVSLDSDIVLTFDVEMDTTAGGDVYLDGMQLPPGTWSSDGKIYTISNSEFDLDLEMEYEIEIQDFTGMDAVVMNEKSVVFTTEGLPVVISTTPTDGAVDVPVSGDLVITFDKEMGVEGIVRMNGEVLTGGALDSSGMNYIIPYSGLEYEKSYRVVCYGFEDANGFEMDGREVFRFTTAAKPIVKARVTSVAPVTEVAVKGTLEIKFDKAMDVDYGAIQLNGKTHNGTWANSVTLLVAYEGLEHDKSYEVKLVDFIDGEGNAIDPYTATVTTAKKKEESKTVTSCAISFDANGGDPVKTTLAVKDGDAYGKLPAATRKGYTFTGWFTKKEGGAAVTENTKPAQYADHTLYAGWKANTYTVKFDVNKGETIKTKSKKITYDTKVGALPKPSPRRLGNIFCGWYTAKKGGKRVTADTIYAAAGNTTLYARWKVMYNRGKARKNVAKVPILSKPSLKNGKVLGYYKKGAEFIIIKRHMRPNNTCDFVQVNYKGKAAWVRSSLVVAYKIYPKK